MQTLELQSQHASDIPHTFGMINALRGSRFRYSIYPVIIVQSILGLLHNNDGRGLIIVLIGSAISIIRSSTGGGLTD